MGLAFNFPLLILVNAQEQQYELKSAFKAEDLRVITYLLENFTLSIYTSL